MGQELDGAWKFLAPNQNLPFFGLFRPRNSRKPEDFGAVRLLMGQELDGAWKFLAFQASKQPKTGRFWCGALVDEPRTGWGLEI